MNATRILKEARPLFWPWCAVVLAGAVPLLHPPVFALLFPLLAWLVGIPLLATLALGNEFQQRTISLQLSQPVSRIVIWGEKTSVTAAAVVSSALVIYFSLSVASNPYFQVAFTWPIAIAVIIDIIAAATFWTLLTRSTIGGVALNLAANFLLIGVGAKVAELARGTGPLTPANVSLVLAPMLLVYAGVMLWLGLRSLARFQITGGMAGDNLLTAGTDVMPGALASWLRCRPTGVVLNLFRKEIRMLRPVWLITLLALLVWTCVAVVGLPHERRPSSYFELTVLSIGVISTLMIALLAGSVSLGEERTSGTHAWQRTLPVPAMLQWSIKLGMALVASVLGALLLPALVMVTGQLLRSRHVALGSAHIGEFWAPAGIVVLLTLGAFWCACAADGTMSAVLWVIPLTLTLGFASYFAILFAYKLLATAFSLKYNPYDGGWWFDGFARPRYHLNNLLGNLKFDWWIANVVDRHYHLSSLIGTRIFYAELVASAASLLGLVQSYRFFRAPLRNSTRSIVRNLLALAVLVFLCGFSLTVFDGILWRAGGMARALVGETNRAIQKNLPAAAKLDATHPLHLTVDDVAKAWPFPLEENSRRWLRDARITVAPDKAHPGGFYCTAGPSTQTLCYYSATIELADGTVLTESHDPTVNRPTPWGFRSVYIRWPGAAGEGAPWEWEK